MLEEDALTLSAALQAREVSAREVMASTLARIEAVNGDINAIVSLRDPDVLLQESEAADASPRKGWLHGVPFAVKDLADASGLPTSQGSPLYAGTAAGQDDPIVARIRAAGAIIIGKTNTPAFGLGSHTVNPVFGATRNPYDTTRSAGGSSGGAAAALATRMVCVADGSDMMGSLRNPAAWNNVYGMRPTWGTVPSGPDGELYFWQLSTAGPMACTPRDLAALLDTMAGPLAGLPYVRETRPCLPEIERPVEAPCVGWLGDWDGALPMEPGLLDFCEAALPQMANLGWQIDSLPAPFPADALWQSWCRLRSFSVAGSRRGDYDDKARRAHLNPPMLWEIEHGRSLRAEDIFAASEVRSDWFRAALAMFQRYDAVLLPSAQVWPFDVTLPHPADIAGRQMDTYHRWMQVVIPASLIGLPVVNLPIGFGPQGLPMGLQLIGAPGVDSLLLRLAESWHQVTEWPQRRPG
jgi:amidase